MKLTTNSTVSDSYHAGVCSWGLSYMDGSDTKGWLDQAWSLALWFDNLFRQWILNEAR